MMMDGGYVEQYPINPARGNVGGQFPPHFAAAPPVNNSTRGGGSSSRHHRDEYREQRGRGSSTPSRRFHPQEEFFPVFFSWEEERDWVEDRLRKKRSRSTLFDKAPSEEQQRQMQALKLLTEVAKTSSSLLPAVSVLPQQTRHARRLYVGQLPENVNETEVHDFFRNCIAEALGSRDEDDPILSVYINRERRFAFVEFKTMEMTTACMALDGINILGRGIIKIKRPNDYNPSLAPPQASIGIPNFDVSKLGIVASTVPDGPNKIFIGGLPYHLKDVEVMELLGAFGPIRSFHLVKDDPTSTQSKGYCFVEYVNPDVTPIAVSGLNGMDLGGGKTLSARIAATRGASTAGESTNYFAQLEAEADMAAAAAGAAQQYNNPSSYATSTQYQPVIQSEVDALLNAALGGSLPMPQQQQMMQQHPGALADMAAAYLNQAFPPGSVTNINTATPGSIMTQVAASNAADIASAALNAAFGGGGALQQPMFVQQPPKTRILVLLNMVTDEDLATEEAYNDLREEVREECQKYGNLLSIKIPRVQDGFPATSNAIRKIFLEYATVQDAAAAETELSGRSFGNNVVQASYFDEEQYLAGNLW